MRPTRGLLDLAQEDVTEPRFVSPFHLEEGYLSFKRWHVTHVGKPGPPCQAVDGVMKKALVAVVIWQGLLLGPAADTGVLRGWRTRHDDRPE